MSNYNVLPDRDGVCYCYPLPISVIRGYFLRSSDFYYLRYNIRYGNLSWRIVYSRLDDMLRRHQLNSLALWRIKTDGSIVFFWRADGWQSVMEELRFLARSYTLQPLADFEFVHPFSSSIICSLGVYSNGKFADTYRNEMGRCVVDLKQPLEEVR